MLIPIISSVNFTRCQSQTHYCFVCGVIHIHTRCLLLVANVETWASHALKNQNVRSWLNWNSEKVSEGQITCSIDKYWAVRFYSTRVLNSGEVRKCVCASSFAGPEHVFPFYSLSKLVSVYFITHFLWLGCLQLETQNTSSFVLKVTGIDIIL